MSNGQETEQDMGYTPSNYDERVTQYLAIRPSRVCKLAGRLGLMDGAIIASADYLHGKPFKGTMDILYGCAAYTAFDLVAKGFQHLPFSSRV